MVGIMAVLIAIEMGTLYFAVHTLSSVRALVGAEGLWSKAQKDAVYNLQQYSQTHNEKDEQAFYDFMKVPMGDQKTLVQLRKKNPDFELARQGLLEGRNHPDDIDGMLESVSKIQYDNLYSQSCKHLDRSRFCHCEIRTHRQKITFRNKFTFPISK